MNCIKCGREIPEGQMFCQECKLPPVVIPKELPPEPKPKKQPVKKKKKAKKKFDLHKTLRRLRIALIAVCTLLATLLAIVGTELNAYLERKENLRQKEANIVLREREADNRDNRIKELEKTLEAAENTIARLQRNQ